MNFPVIHLIQTRSKQGVCGCKTCCRFCRFSGWTLTQALIPHREDDDCTAWSVTRQNTEPPSKRVTVSLPLTSLSENTASICTFIAACLRAAEEPECWFSDKRHQRLNVVRVESKRLSMESLNHPAPWAASIIAPVLVKCVAWTLDFFMHFRFLNHNKILSFLCLHVNVCAHVCLQSSKVKPPVNISARLQLF